MFVILPIKDENPHPPGFKPKLTIALIIINVLVFFYQVSVTGQFLELQMVDPNTGTLFPNTIKLFYEWGTVPYCISGGDSINLSIDETNPLPVSCPDIPMLTLLSSMFMHGSIMHLGGNMLFLWIFGDNIEAKFGKAKFLGIYLLWGIVASFAHIAIDPASGAPGIGASGAISGVMGAYLIIFPKARVLTMMWVFFIIRWMHLSAKWILLYYLIVQNLFPVIFSSLFSTGGGGVAYMAHIGGFVIGLAFGYMYKKTHSSEYTYGTRYGWKGN